MTCTHLGNLPPTPFRFIAKPSRPAKVSTMPDPLLKTLHLSRKIADKTIVDDISIEASRGEILAIMGPSGSGKSSFLRLLNRLDEPTAGSVLLDDTDTKSLPPRELRRRIGMVL